MSALPPAGNGTIILTDRLGYGAGCAAAGPIRRRAVRAAANTVFGFIAVLVRCGRQTARVRSGQPAEREDIADAERNAPSAIDRRSRSARDL
jgi:hypothetical protein